MGYIYKGEKSPRHWLDKNCDSFISTLVRVSRFH